MALSGTALLCLAPEKDEQTVDPRSPWSPDSCNNSNFGDQHERLTENGCEQFAVTHQTEQNGWHWSRMPRALPSELPTNF